MWSADCAVIICSNFNQESGTQVMGNYDVYGIPSSNKQQLRTSPS